MSDARRLRDTRGRTRPLVEVEIPRVITDRDLAALAAGAKRPGEIEVRDVWLEVDVEDRWRAAFRLVPYAGQPVIAEVRLFPRDEWGNRRPGAWRAEFLGLRAGQITGPRRDTIEPATFAPIRHGVTAQLLRQIPLGATQAAAREFMGEIQQRFPGLYPPEWSRPRRETPRPASAWPDRVYAQIAAAYVERLDAGSRRPVADVARRRRLSPAQVRDAIHTARGRGFLTAAVQRGRSGGALTRAAQHLLNKRARRPR